MNNSLVRDTKYLDEQYRIGDGTISDDAFKQLEKLFIPAHPEFDYFNQNKNRLLPKLAKENYKDFLGSLLTKTRLSIQPKIDGCAIAIRYINGKFNKAITKKGFDVTSKIKQIKNVPDCIPIKRDFQIRGELYATNQVAGISQRIARKYLNDKKRIGDSLSFCCFQILNGRLNQYETLNYLKKCGFNTPESYFTNLTSEIEIYKKNWLERKIFAKYPTDGIVIKINSRKLQLLRETSLSQNNEWQYAIENTIN
ncbi:NAD-dependent DNA ligase [Prochlorococcus marinus]|uniref:NAD-dependent DNA ligase n=1 Tax=Prochlorococcus marinus TaxID=1219 RepID=UPI001ADAFC4F|nr:NAD-dependent DNA ligase [Prochlorococcus marinus]MBO8205076.1 NAD-dependent DNA ligase [Prochlorococcus marinus CUG1415]MBW3044351.1 NAD-dependent DNA ligase [Prochlorococcus marinus str. MU1415]